MHFGLMALWSGVRYLFSRATGWIMATLYALLPWVTTTVLMSIGMGFVTYVGMDFALSFATDILLEKFNDRPSEYVAILQYIGADDAISIFIAGMTTSATVRATTSATRINWMSTGR